MVLSDLTTSRLIGFTKIIRQNAITLKLMKVKSFSSNPLLIIANIATTLDIEIQLNGR